jgi:hypothetical protein
VAHHLLYLVSVWKSVTAVKDGSCKRGISIALLVGLIAWSGVVHSTPIPKDGVFVNKLPIDVIDVFQPLLERKPEEFGVFAAGGLIKKTNEEIQSRLPWVFREIEKKLGSIRPRSKIAYASGGLLWSRLKEKAHLVTQIFNDEGFALAIPLHDNWKATFYGIAIGETLRAYRNVVAMGNTTGQLFVAGSTRMGDKSYSDIVGESVYYDEFVDCLQQRDQSGKYAQNAAVDSEPGWRACERLQIADLKEKLSAWPKFSEAVAVGILMHRFPNGASELAGTGIDVPTIKKQYEDGCSISPYDKYFCHSPLHAYAFLSALGVFRIIAPPPGTDWPVGAALYAAECLRPHY